MPELSSILAREGPGDWASRYDQLAGARDAIIPNVGPRYRPRDLQRAMTAEERRTLEAQRDQLDGLSKFFGDIGVSGIRIKHDADTLEHTGLLDTLGDTAVMIGGSLPEMGMAAAPGGLMLPAISTSHFERFLAGLRAENPDLPEARLAPTAFASALTDTALSRAEILFAGGRLPGLRGALAKPGTAEGKIGVLAAGAAAAGEKLAASGLPGRALVAGARFAGRGAATIGTELLQNVTPDAWKSVTHALHQDIKGADWDAVVARERAALGDTALLSMGLVVVFGTGRRALDYIGEGDLRTLLTDQRAIEEQGIPKAIAKQVAEVSQSDPAAGADLAKQAADTTPVEERREQILILQEQMEQEQQMGEGEQEGQPAPEGDPEPQDALREDKEAGEGTNKKSKDRTDDEFLTRDWLEPDDLVNMIGDPIAAKEDRAFAKGYECRVYPLGRDKVRKVARPEGILAHHLPDSDIWSSDPKIIRDRLKVLRALGGLKTTAGVDELGRIVFIQERGRSISSREYENVRILGHKPRPGATYEFEIEGRLFTVSDLDQGNFIKDKNGVIRIADLVVGENPRRTSSLDLDGKPAIRLDHTPSSDNESE